MRNIRQSMLKLPTHSGFHDLFLNYLYQYKLFYYEFDWLWNSCNTKDIIEGCTTASDKLLMIYFYNSINYFSIGTKIYANTVVCFDWKTVIYIYVCTQFMLQMEKSVTFTSACANEIIPSINRSFVYKAKEGRYVRITFNVISTPNPIIYIYWQ
jgi:hypothetical protein